MSEILRIRGGRPLNGDVWVSGSKNAAVALIPAALLADSPSTIDNIPDIDDVDCYRNILEHLGAKVCFEKGSMYIDPRGVNKNELHSEMVSRMRASYYLVPTLMGRTGKAVVPMLVAILPAVLVVWPLTRIVPVCWWRFLLTAFAGVVSTGAGIWFWGLTEGEKGFIRSKLPFRK